jgi:hypothetical protein
LSLSLKRGTFLNEKNKIQSKTKKDPENNKNVLPLEIEEAWG